MSKLPDSVIEEYGPKLIDAVLHLADGSKVYGSGATLPGDMELILWLDKKNNLSMMDAFGFFGDPEKSKQIVYTNAAGEEKIFEGYTVIRFIKADDDGKISLKLAREV